MSEAGIILSSNDDPILETDSDTAALVESTLGDSPLLEEPLQNESEHEFGAVRTTRSHASDEIRALRARGAWDVFFHHSFVIDNEVTEARDLCQAERNAMAWVRACSNLGFVGGVLLLNLRLPSIVEDDNASNNTEWNDLTLLGDGGVGTRASFILGLIFFGWSISGTVLAFINYVYVVTGYIKKLNEVRNVGASYVFCVIIAVTALFTNIFYLVHSG